MSTVTFAKGGGAKAAPKAGAKGKAPAKGIVGAAIDAVTGGGGPVLNGTVNGKKGFQPGNQYAKGRKGGTASTKASGKHRSARNAVSKHVAAGTLSTPEGRAAVKASAAAHRELQAARTEAASAKSAQAKADRAVKSGKAEPLAATAPDAPAKPNPIAERVAESAKDASGMKADRAHKHLEDLHATAKSGHLKATEIHAHVERIARGATKDELFAAAKKAGIAHEGIATKKALVEHLKSHAHGLGKPEPMSLEDFAARAVKGAHEAPAGGFGDSKTFISHAKAHLDRTDPQIAKMSPDEFKAKLLEAHRARHLELGRADLVEAMHPDDVRHSTTVHQNVEYHFIRHPATDAKVQSKSRQQEINDARLAEQARKKAKR